MSGRQAPVPVAVMLALAIGGCSPLGVVAVPEAITVFTTIIPDHGLFPVRRRTRRYARHRSQDARI